MRKTSEVCLKYWNKGLVHPPGFPLQKGGGLADLSKCGCSSVVEFQLPKLVMWVRLPSLAPRGQQKAPLPLFSFSLSPGVYPGAHAGVAQLVEQLICNQQVGGSSPSTSSRQETAFFPLSPFSHAPGLGGTWRHGQAVKTRPFHGCNMGSNPVGVTIPISAPLNGLGLALFGGDRSDAMAMWRMAICRLPGRAHSHWRKWGAARAPPGYKGGSF